jgi:hypothetical protein
MPTKANLKRQVRLRENKDIKFANRICKSLSNSFFINVFISLIFLQYFHYFERIHLVRLLLLCYNSQGGTGGVSFPNKHVSGIRKYLFKISK